MSTQISSFQDVAVPATSTNSGPTPMEIDTTTIHSKSPSKLSDAEKKRRKEAHLCIYCGESACPGKTNVELCPKLIQRKHKQGNANSRAAHK